MEGPKDFMEKRGCLSQPPRELLYCVTHSTHRVKEREAQPREFGNVALGSKEMGDTNLCPRHTGSHQSLQ